MTPNGQIAIPLDTAAIREPFLNGSGGPESGQSRHTRRLTHPIKWLTLQLLAGRIGIPIRMVVPDSLA